MGVGLMPYAYLPAHNVTNIISGFTGATIVGGPEALATTSQDTYVEFVQEAAHSEPEVRIGYHNTTGASVLGFGLWDQPPGSTVTDIRFIASGFISMGSSAPPPITEAFFASQGPGTTNVPVYRSPLIMLRWGGDPWPSFGGYNISTFPVDFSDLTFYAECAVQLQHMIGDASYVIAGIGTPDNGTNGLQPVVWVPAHPWPVITQVLRLYYLAIRITYTLEAAKRLHVQTGGEWKWMMPRSGENEGIGVGKMWLGDSWLRLPPD